ncbi:hypothetical protein [Marinobacter sp. tcs-11]|jgi:hypothetical protein|uniref:hypothetical protein n=1 Tax=Marinobacter sp. tcs-11 TaxID=1742860 RepID=UPI002579E6E8|nr:hypothetical protein [Marinobacter sp. tcs-11]
MKKIASKSTSLNFRLKNYSKKGGKKHRNRQLQRIYKFIKYCDCPPDQIGNRHVTKFFEDNIMAQSTKRDYYYAIKLLWHMLGRNKNPKKPKVLEDCL